MMGFGKSIDITIADDKTVTVRDYGRGVPLGKLVDVASKMNTGAKYDSKAFKKSVGLNGVGIKAVNALSDAFLIRSVRDGEARSVRFEKGNEIADVSESGVGEKERDDGVVPCRRKRFRQLRLSHGIRGVDGTQLHLPERRADDQGQRAGVRLEKRAARPAAGKPRRRAALPARSPQRGGHRSGHHARARLRRNLLLVRQRSAYDAGRNASDRFPAKGSPRRSRNFTKRTTMRQTSARR